MKSLVFLISVIAVGFHANSQNWQTFKSNSVKYYQTTNDYIYGVRFDSVDVISGDSIFYSFKTLREVNNPDSIPYYYSLKSSGAWFGERLIIKQNGDNVFINRNSDSIIIKTLANIGDSYTMYNYPNGASVIATLTGIDTATYYGITDSIKTFELQFNGSTNLTNPIIKLGKTLGLTSIYQFFRFPRQYQDHQTSRSMLLSFEPYKLVGQDFPKLGITKPTYQDIFSFEIGDIIQYKKNDFTQLKVLAKINLANDSTQYEILRQIQSNGALGNIVLIEDTIILKYNTSSNYYSKFMPEEFNHQYFDSTALLKGITRYTAECGFRDESLSYGENVILYEPNYDRYYINFIHYGIKTDQVLSNAGDFYYSTVENSFGLNYSGQYFIYKSNSPANCGQQGYLNIDILKKIDNVAAFPNPTSDQINVQLDEPIVSIEIYNLNGSKIISANQQIVDIRHLENGAYILVIKSNKKTYRRKIVKI